MLLTALLALAASTHAQPLPLSLGRSALPELQAGAAQSRQARVRELYRDLFEERDEQGLAQLWRENEDLILSAFHEDLEAGLALWEEAPDEPDVERIQALWARALFGARAAGAATGRPIFRDYAAAFVGWDAQQRRAFRVRQQLHQRALGELRGAEIDPSGAEALVAREVWVRALDLGDWWGAAMGYEVEGRAHLRAGMHKEALIAFSQARLYFGQLGLRSDELGTVRHLVVLCEMLGTWPRSLALADEGLALARALGRGDSLRELLEGRARAERALGDAEAAQRTALELEALGG